MLFRSVEAGALYEGPIGIARDLERAALDLTKADLPRAARIDPVEHVVALFLVFYQ